MDTWEQIPISKPPCLKNGNPGKMKKIFKSILKWISKLFCVYFSSSMILQLEKRLKLEILSSFWSFATLDGVNKWKKIEHGQNRCVQIFKENKRIIWGNQRNDITKTNLLKNHCDYCNIKINRKQRSLGESTEVNINSIKISKMVENIVGWKILN